MARSRSLIAPAVAVLVSGIVGGFFFSMVNSNDTKAVVQAPPIIKEAPTVQILVANNNISVGKKLTTNDLSWRAWPESLLNQEYITIIENPDKIDKLIGGIAKIAMVSGEPIIEGKIVQSGDRGAMAVLLRKGMRAVSVPISADTSAGGFILPGDFVDIIMTSSVIRENLFKSKIENQSGQNNTAVSVEPPVLQSYLELKALSKKLESYRGEANNKQQIQVNLSDKKLNQDQKNQLELSKKLSQEDELLVASNTYITEVLLENVRVLAIDQSVNQTGSAPSEQQADPSAQAGGGETSAKLGTTATLEVTPEQAKLLAWSASSGKLTLSLRSFGESLGDDGQNETSGQSIPLTKTSFAWPLQKIIGINNQPTPQKKSDDKDKATPLVEAPILSGGRSPFDSIQLIRSGRVSTFTTPPLQSLLPEDDLKPQQDKPISDANATKSEGNTVTQPINANVAQTLNNSQGAVNVKRQ